MVKCLNIGKNIGKPIYRSISMAYPAQKDHKHITSEVKIHLQTPNMKSNLVWLIRFKSGDFWSVF